MHIPKLFESNPSHNITIQMRPNRNTILMQLCSLVMIYTGLVRPSWEHGSHQLNYINLKYHLCCISNLNQRKQVHPDLHHICAWTISALDTFSFIYYYIKCQKMSKLSDHTLVFYKCMGSIWPKELD